MTRLPERQYEALTSLFEGKRILPYEKIAAQRIVQLCKDQKVDDIQWYYNDYGLGKGTVVLWIDSQRPIVPIYRIPLEKNCPINDRMFFLDPAEKYLLGTLQNAGHLPGIALCIGQSGETMDNQISTVDPKAANCTLEYFRTEYWKNLVPYPGVPHAYRLIEVNRAPFVHPDVFTNFLNRIDPLGD
jgi:hypothetical protein